MWFIKLKVLKIWCTGKKCSMLSMEECSMNRHFMEEDDKITHKSNYLQMRRKTGKRKGGGGEERGSEERKLESITFNPSHPKLFDNKI
ncbi:hypothetical protein NC652_027984 [Populus alba x Populus x berolinensis]|nr:hypothetical protein NC652_027984 [Populus alba x Populus x berolinensis]